VLYRSFGEERGSIRKKSSIFSIADKFLCCIVLMQNRKALTTFNNTLMAMSLQSISQCPQQDICIPLFTQRKYTFIFYAIPSDNLDFLKKIQK